MANILLIDDDADLRQFLQDALRQRGHHVEGLERADRGVDVLATGEFDLVLVDQHMPGLSGSEFLQVLRKKEIRIPAILMTGLAKGTLVEPMRKLDAFVVGKPAGGFAEFLKELDLVLDDALQGEAEILASLKRTVDVALKAGKTSLFYYLRGLLNRELFFRVQAEINGNQQEAKRILGVPLSRLLEAEQPLSMRTEALLFIANHPELSVNKIADRLDVSKSKLYRDPIIKRALMDRKDSGTPPHGYTTAEGEVEAWDDE
ncbi:MAG TPA: response regulator [Gemmataceae bacterium]|nr:response regulator [Gemmataceae bacterium]